MKKTKNPARVLIIAGSDSGGGAGIQGDIKTVTCLGGYAATAITALTAQNTKGVFAIHNLPEKFIAQQIELVLSDIGADAIKTGMLSSVGIIKTIVKSLSKYSKVPLVVDPVMVAKGGHKLLEDDAVRSLKNLLIPRGFILTPNIPEAEVLTQKKIRNFEDMLRAGEKLLELGCKNVLMKGGHKKAAKKDEGIFNFLVNKNGYKVFRNPRLDTKNTHGTGCTLASAIATHLALGLDVEAACERSVKYVFRAIKSSHNIGSGHGPLNHFV